MARPRTAFLLAAILFGLAGAAHEALAGVTVDLLFVQRNGAPLAPTNTVTASAGDTLLMQVLFMNDVGLTGIAFSLNYDLDGKNELDVSSALQWAGLALNKANTVGFRPLGGAFGLPTSTFIGSFNGVLTPPSLPPTLALPPGTYQIGAVSWLVNAGVDVDGADISSGFLNPLPQSEAILGADFMDISGTAVFHSATVNVPEPGTAALLGFALVGLILVRRWQPGDVKAAGEGSPIA